MERQYKRRRIRLIKPRFQLRLIGAFGGLCVLALLVHTLMVGAILTTMASRSPEWGTGMAAVLPGALGKALLWSFLLLLPSLLLLGIHWTFKIAGPLFRFESHLGAVARGEDPGPCRLRKNDDLKELCELINQGLEHERRSEPRALDEER